MKVMTMTSIQKNKMSVQGCVSQRVSTIASTSSQSYLENIVGKWQHVRLGLGRLVSRLLFAVEASLDHVR